LLLAVVVGGLSLISSSVSFFVERSYSYSHNHRYLLDETLETVITVHGFPVGWYSESRGIIYLDLSEGYEEYEASEFHPSAFFANVACHTFCYAVTAAVALSLYKDRDVRKLFSKLKPSSRKTACA